MSFIPQNDEIVPNVPEEGGQPPEAKALSRPVREPSGRWVPGCPSPNPLGKPRGGGRVGVLRMIDELLSEGATLNSLKGALRNMAMTDPILFWRVVVLPILPKEASVSLGGNGTDTATAVLMVRRALGMPESGGGS